MNTFGLENILKQRVPALKHRLYPSFEPSPYIPARERMRDLLSEHGRAQARMRSSRHPIFPTEPTQHSTGGAQRRPAGFGSIGGSHREGGVAAGAQL